MLIIHHRSQGFMAYVYFMKSDIMKGILSTVTSQYVPNNDCCTHRSFSLHLVRNNCSISATLISRLILNLHHTASCLSEASDDISLLRISGSRILFGLPVVDCTCHDDTRSGEDGDRSLKVPPAVAARTDSVWLCQISLESNPTNC